MTEKKIALHWINGEWVDAGDHRDSVDPATMQIIGTYSSGGVETANQAIQVAKEAFRKTSWKSDRVAGLGTARTFVPSPTDCTPCSEIRKRLSRCSRARPAG